MSTADLILALRATAEHVAELNSASLAEVMGRSHSPRIARARHAVWAAFRDMDQPPMSYPDIASFFNVDHTTVLDGVRSHRRRALAKFRPARCLALGEIARCG